MAEIQTYDKKSEALSSIEVDESAFGDKVKKRLLNDALLMYEACRRQGTHSTLTRAEVNRTTRKPYRQKGTGSARCGDFRSPLRRGGGVIFGPKPRDYSYSMPRKAKKEALRNAFYAKLKDGEIYAVDGFVLEKPSTREAVLTLKKLNLTGKTLVLVGAADEMIYKSFRNITGVRIVSVSDVNAEHLLRHANIAFLNGAFEGLKERLGNG
jgi:large subunit ribosomal protein L4